MNCLIIGHGGFIGRHVLMKIKETDGPQKVHFFNIELENSLKKIGYENSNYLQKVVEKLTKFLIQKKIEYIINCAGTIGTFLNKNSDKQLATAIITAMKNINSTIRLIQIGSSSEYSPTNTFHKITENTKCEPTTLYGKRKLAVTQYLIKEAVKHKLSICILRVFNVIGPKMNTNTLLGKIYNELVDKKNSSINVGSLDHYRDYIDVRDLASAINLLCRKLSTDKHYIEVLNIGSGNVIKIRKLVGIISSHIYPYQTINETTSLNKIDEVNWQLADISKLKRIIEWYPKYNINESVEYFLSLKHD